MSTAAPAAVASRRLDAHGRPFLVALACCTGMGALSIDMLLPAFPELRAHVGLAEGSTAIAQVLTSFFVGLAFGQLLFGPLADRWGRRPLLQCGLAVMAVAALATIFTTSLAAMVICRFVWGFGAAAPRALVLAMVRDCFDGDEMASRMSTLMAIFMVVPVVAPGLGALVLAVGDWRAVIGVQAALIVALLVATLWFPETLDPANRRSIGPRALLAAGREVLGHRTTVCFGIAATVLFGALTAYIGSAEVFFDEVFDAESLFPLWFGVVAVFMGAGSLLTAGLVRRLGLHQVLALTAIAVVATAGLLLGLAIATAGTPPLWAFVVVLCVLLPALVMLLPNCNTAAMQPLGRVAGTGAAVLGMVSSGGGALLGMVADTAYDGTVTPFATWVAIYAAIAAVCVAVGRAPARASAEPAPPLQPTEVL